MKNINLKRGFGFIPVILVLAIVLTAGAIGFKVSRDTVPQNGEVGSGGKVVTAGVSSSLTLTAGTGLTGGGDLSANRTFAIDFTRANTWTGLQSFSANASSTGFSANYASIGGTASTTMSADGKVRAVQFGGGRDPLSTWSFAAQSGFTTAAGTYYDFGNGNARVAESTYSILFSTYTGASLTEKMRILGNGNVGIATTTPMEALDVKGGIVSEEQTLTFSATPTFDFSTGNSIVMTMTNNVTGITFSNATRGKGVKVILCQDGTGSRTVAGWPTSILWTGGTAPTMTATANKCDIFTFTASHATTSAVKYLGGYVQNF